MTRYVALLRGINVSGQKIIKMDHLKRFFESLQFQNVKTYIQSGNVIFDTGKEETDTLRKMLESKLHEVFGFEVTVVIRTIDEMEEIIKRNPFNLNESQENEKIYVSFLSGEPGTEAIASLLTYKNEVDDFHVLKREVYILCRGNYGKSLFSNNFLEKKLKLSATTRNWQTVNKLAAMGLIGMGEDN
ncbi:MAG: hypothetical protein K0S39_1940 [Paenibacillus sp.]|nr:hypothetical protein [Paenibacillus sp.]